MEDDPFFEDKVIEVKQGKRKIWRYVILALVAVLFLYGSQLIGIYVDALWFDSLGFGDVYWYKFKLGAVLFLVFLVATFLILRLPFIALNRALPQLTERTRLRPKTVEDLREINFLPLIYRPGVWLLSVGVALMYALGMSQQWPTFALYLNSAPAGVADPIFNKDAGFYLFDLPALELVAGWFVTMAVILFLVIAGASAYTWYIERMQGFSSPATARKAAAAVSLAGAFLAVAFAVETYLSRFDLLYTRHDLFTGIGYTDANVRLPVIMILIVLLLAVAVALVFNAFSIRRARLVGWAAGVVFAVWVIGLLIVPALVQSFSVKPNELAKEAPYIQHNITKTRQGFALDRFEEKPFQPAPTLTEQKIVDNRPTLENIRLWDPRVLQSTISQVQEIRQYYEFREPDIDRYVINGKTRQVMVAAREMNVDQLEAQSRNWINQHLVYTHGYGVTMSTVNEFTQEGLPRLVLRNMPVESEVPEIKITRPEIYFGELTNVHVYVNTRSQSSTQPEFNYPAPDNTDSYNEYDGKAGIPVGGFFRKTALSIFLGDGTNLLFSDYIDSNSRVMIRRNILARVRSIAPFLMYETDPYIVIGQDGRLYWIIDAFTHSNRYPYSTGYTVANRGVNYIRNSVKVVLDAYEGEVKFYIFDPEDPIIKSYQSIFPSLFVSSDEMSSDLRSHIRYPDMLAEAQAHAYTLYHVESAQTFYNREDLWAIPAIDQPAQQGPAQPGAEAAQMEPYYVLMQLPSESEKNLEFISILPFTPAGPGRNNMIGWMAARSDGDKYGQTLVFTFPKNVTVAGPMQIKARINQDARLSAQLSLWDRAGSKVLRGNLQVIPLADSLLYIEPFYLAAENSQIPELRQVAVATQDRLATDVGFETALRTLVSELGGQKPSIDAQAAQQPAQQPGQPPGQPPAQQPAQIPAQQPGQTAPSDTAGLARQAQQLFTEYERLAAAGRHREAGEKLDQLKQVLAELARARGGQ